MKIKEVGTRQFAGIKNKNIQLNDGLNILVGKNESGKSTIIELIYQILYRNSNLDKRADKDFYEKYFPSGSKGDFVQGKLIFKTDDGDYTLEKKWGAISSAEIIDEKGNIFASEDMINNIINNELTYKKGLYDDVVFASQKKQSDIVAHILNKLDKKSTVKQDFVSIIASEGLSSTGGIEPDDIERIIQARIERLSGHWDFDIDGPEKRRGIENKWKMNVGEILEAYYNLADDQALLRRIEMAEKAVDNDNNRIAKGQALLNSNLEEKREYERFAEVVARYNANKLLKLEYSSNKDEIMKDQAVYPQYLDNLASSLKLRNAKNAQDIVGKYTSIAEKKLMLEGLRKELESIPPIDNDDVKKVSDLGSQIVALKAKLANLNLVADIKKLSDVEVQVKSLATGELVPINDGIIDINETVEITIPNIISMTLSAKGVDVVSIKRDIEEKESEVAALLAKAHAKDYEDMQHRRERYADLSTKVEFALTDYNNIVAGVDVKKLEDDYQCAKDKAIVENLDDKIKELCGVESIDAYVAKQQANIDLIEDKYGSQNPIGEMERRLESLDNDLHKIEIQEKDAENIPQKYKDLTDIDEYKQSLNDMIEAATNEIEDARKALEADKAELGDISPDDLRMNIEDERNELLKLKEECLRWNHILEVLRKTKDMMSGESTMQDVQERFADYLQTITSGRVLLNSMDENMDVDIQSGDNHLSFEILSEGTKDTIALAFRLAMLEHLFPDGGGLVVLDDPFTDMDEERTKQACMLVQKFAENGNQVIFVTCDNKYKKLLTGNVIEM